MQELAVLVPFANTKTKGTRRKGGRGRQPRHIKWISPRFEPHPNPETSLDTLPLQLAGFLQQPGLLLRAHGIQP
jgi:hypothetical protein